MTLSRELLMRYYDGAVSEAEAALVGAAVEREPALAEELQAYAELGHFVRAWGEARSEYEIDLADDVLARIDALSPSAPVALATVHSLWPRVATWISLGAAIAAGTLFVFRSWSTPPHASPRARVPGIALSSAQLAAAAPPAVVAPPDVSAALEEEPKDPPATIESVDFGETSGTVFVVSTDSAETPVVWTPDDGDDEDRSKSL